MSQFSTDFSEYSTGSAPSDWTLQWDAWTSASVETDASGSSFGDQVLRLYTGFSTSAISWDDLGTPTDVDITARIRVTDSGGFYGPGIVARASEDSNGKDGYYAVIDAGNNKLDLFKIVDNSPTLLISAAAPSPAMLLSTWYWIRFQLSGSALRVRFWRDGDPEPGSWQIDTTDSTFGSGGFAGIMSKFEHSEVDWFGAGTGGSAPPTRPSATGKARMTQLVVEVLRENRVGGQPAVVVIG
jgi:hypothetical protein